MVVEVCVGFGAVDLTFLLVVPVLTAADSPLLLRFRFAMLFLFCWPCTACNIADAEAERKLFLTKEKRLQGL